MRDAAGNWIAFNGEIYNYLELREELGRKSFRTTSDTEVILAAYRRWGADCVNHFRGMFAFALWDEAAGRLFCARDRFGIKPFYYATVGDALYFASEAKALLPFLPDIETDLEALKEYLAFQFCLGGQTLFKGDFTTASRTHPHGASENDLDPQRYWEVYYDIDYHHTAKYFEDRLCETLQDSVRIHLRSDVPVGAYLSGGLDSSVVARVRPSRRRRESHRLYRQVSITGLSTTRAITHRAWQNNAAFGLSTLTINAADFIENIRNVIYHLDYPVGRTGLVSAIYGCGSCRASTARSSWADRAATRFSAGTRAI